MYELGGKPDGERPLSSNVVIQLDQDGTFSLVAEVPIAKGEEILAPYGAIDIEDIKDPYEYLLDTYGFLRLGNQTRALGDDILPLEQCEQLFPSIAKYLSPEGACIRGPRVACNLAKLVLFRCGWIQDKSVQMGLS